MNIKLVFSEGTYEQITVLNCPFSQKLNEHGFPTGGVVGGFITLQIPLDIGNRDERPPSDFLVKWMIDSKMRKDGKVEYYSGDDNKNPQFIIDFKEAYCYEYLLSANSIQNKDTGVDSGYETISISAKITDCNGGTIDKTRVWPK